MAIVNNVDPFIPEAFNGLSDRELDDIAILFSSPQMKRVCELQKRLHDSNRAELDPVGYSAQDYHDTMLHLKRASDLWAGMAEYCTKATEAQKLKSTNRS